MDDFHSLELEVIMSTDTIAPTAERIKRSGTVVEMPTRDQKTARPYHRVMPLWEQMEGAGELTHDQARAIEEFAGHVLTYSRGIIRSASYGARSEGDTPASQSTDERLTPAERRACAARRITEARRAVAAPTWMTILENAINEGWGKTNIGCALGHKNSRAACGAAVTMLQHIGDKLADLYQIARSRDRTA